MSDLIDALAALVETIFPKGAAFRRSRLGTAPWIDAFALLEKHGVLSFDGSDYRWAQ